jgi:hypothetical protein
MQKACDTREVGQMRPSVGFTSGCEGRTSALSLAGVTAMSGGWSIDVELACKWSWRCLDEDILVPGRELRVADPESGGLVRLTESGANRVERDDLRHTCGGPVIPVVPLKFS